MDEHLYQLFLALLGTGIAGLIGIVWRHAITDIAYRQKVDDLAKRVSKLDGINGK